MKLSKSKLKQLVRETIAELQQPFKKMSSGEARRSTQASVKQISGADVSPIEYGIIQKLQAQLTKAAKEGNIATGKIARLATLLSQELGEDTPTDQEDQNETHT